MLVAIQYIVQIAMLLLAVSIHESAHGWMAEKFGDNTARYQGRITLNPIAHIDLIGSIIFPAILAFSGAPVFGWAKPVMVNPYNLRHPLRDEIYIAAAGPISNIIAGSIAVLLFVTCRSINIIGNAELAHFIGYLTRAQGANPSPLTLMLFFFAVINIYLAVFNLIPIPPLDGSKILRGLLKGDALRYYMQIEPYGFMILLAVIFFTPAIGIMARPLLNLLLKIMVGVN